MACHTRSIGRETGERRVQGVKKKARVETPVGFVPQADAAACELTIVIPCLNEAETLAQVVDRARRFLAAYDVAGEVVVADNGSTDGSTAIAIAAGARVVPVAERGYGAALRAGIEAARGT